MVRKLFVLLVSTVDCKRGFFRWNLIKTDLRNSLKTDFLRVQPDDDRSPVKDQPSITKRLSASGQLTGMKTRRIL